MTHHAPLRRGAVRAAAFALLAAVAACVDSTTAPAPLVGPPSLDAVTTPACDAALFGPAVFTRTAGPPTTSSTSFAATIPGDFYRLEASDHGASNATVRLNGVEVVTSHDLAGANGSITRDVTLAAHNVLDVRLTGRPGSQLSIRIVDTRTAASVRITPPSMLLLFVGQTRVYAAEALDADGRPITRCVEWSSSNPAFATVTSDGSVHGVSIGTTQLVASVDGVATHLPITVIQSSNGINTGTSYNGYCAMNQPDASLPLGCFDAIIFTTPLEGGQTLIDVSLRNRQGSTGGEALPAANLISVMVFGETGTGPLPLQQLGFGAVGWASGTSRNVDVVNSPVLAISSGQISFPPSPFGPQTFLGTNISQIALLGCATPASITPSAYWRTCGNHAGTLDVSFVSPGAWTSGSLILYLTFNVDPLGGPSPSCTTRPVPGRPHFPLVCQKRLPSLD